MRNEIFPKQRKSKSDPTRDGRFQVFKHINDNTYKINLSGEYVISAIFNVSNLSHFDLGPDSRTNLFEE